MRAHGYDLVQADLFGSVLDLAGTDVQVIRTAHGWVGRRTTPRPRILTPTTPTPQEAVLYLIRLGRITGPPEVHVPIRYAQRARRRGR